MFSPAELPHAGWGKATASMDDDPPVPPDLVRSVIAQNERFVVGTLRPALAEAECVQQLLETQLNDVYAALVQVTCWWTH